MRCGCKLGFIEFDYLDSEGWKEIDRTLKDYDSMSGWIVGKKECEEDSYLSNGVREG